MKPEEQIKALAELDDRIWFVPISERHYRESYDAIIPLIRKVIVHINDIETFMNSGTMDVSGDSFDDIAFQILTKTPPELCEALLRATGKWIS